jgi:hypothetical protein
MATEQIKRGRGRKQNTDKNYQSRKEWMQGKKLGRCKQRWVWDGWTAPPEQKPLTGHWEKIQ